MPITDWRTETDLFPLQYTKAGDIVKLDGLWYKIDRKTTTAVSLHRYYWWDKFYDYVKGKVHEYI
jgi:hypothetical protein